MIPFYLLIGYLLFPLFSLTYIVTHDGPSHIYNAGIIRQLISNASPASDLLILKSFPEPNWIGHFILLLSNLIFSPVISDKIFLGLYIILLPLFFLSLIKRINPNSMTLAYLIVPFVYSIFFYLGVYNFLMGVTILLLAMSSVIPRIQVGGRQLFLRVFIFSVLLYFSHLLALAVFMLVIATALLFSFFETKGISRKEIVNRISGITVAFFPVLILTFIFFLRKLELPNKPSIVTLEEMFSFLIEVRFLITLTYEPEKIYSLVMFGVFATLIVMWIVIKVTAKENQPKPYYQRYPFWLICTLIMLTCFFIIPEEAATGGVVKFRFLLLFYLFLIAFLSVANFPRLVKSLLIVFISSWTIVKMNYLYPMMKQLNEEAKTMMQVTKYIEPNSILLPLRYSTNWLHGNLSNYIGTEKNIFILDNYEANTPHFPVEWKKNRNPISILGEFTGNVPLCADINKFEIQTGKKIDYVMFWGDQHLTDSCTVAINNYLEKNYKEIFADGDAVKLYERSQ